MTSCFEATHCGLKPLYTNYEIAAALENQSHKIRYSDSVEKGSILFSLSGIAFLLMDANECIMSAEEIFLTKIENFLNIHRNSFLVLFAALHGPEEWKLIFRIQQRFLGNKLRILPVHNTANAVNLMCTIAKVKHLGKDTWYCFQVFGFRLQTTLSKNDKYPALFSSEKLLFHTYNPFPLLNSTSQFTPGSHYPLMIHFGRQEHLAALCAGPIGYLFLQILKYKILFRLQSEQSGCKHFLMKCSPLVHYLPDCFPL
ncbi:uncharacterized protein C1orf146 homolog isoform X2 [Fukomys damarensis]|uniref:uncharacterized protein C1orf146 homolog isoform X2 n=1 Tax=Fukomys damarensis TaxID=885580 RepID=UPI0005400362|nr:uncharacterized protein C1orf146 homolog isoform X2 [Fukomys damarensis]